MSDTNNCLGGQISTLQVQNLDCSCVSIKSITWNPAGTQFTITLTNGQSITSPVLTGATGSAPTVVFRVLGTVLQYNVNSAGWVDLYDFSDLIEGVLYNDISNSATIGTSLEILKTYTLPANKLSTNGSYLVVRAEFTTTTTNKTPSADKFVNIYFNNANLIGLNAIVLGFNAQYDKLYLDLRISRFSNTQVKVEMFTQAGSLFNLIGGASLAYPAHFGIFTAGGLDLSANAYDITAVADSYLAGDITCNLLEVTYFKK